MVSYFFLFRFFGSGRFFADRLGFGFFFSAVDDYCAPIFSFIFFP